jgi:dolichol-phosphate mannosyltransferase
MREPMRGFSPMARWVGFNKTTLPVVHGERYEGKSTYNWSKLINLALEISIAYSDKPLKLVVKTGLIISLFSFLFALYNIFGYYTGRIEVIGYASLITSIWLLSGLIILILGIVGLYVGKTFEGIKHRPLYLVDKKTFK